MFSPEEEQLLRDVHRLYVDRTSVPGEQVSRLRFWGRDPHIDTRVLRWLRHALAHVTWIREASEAERRALLLMWAGAVFAGAADDPWMQENEKGIDWLVELNAEGNHNWKKCQQFARERLRHTVPSGRRNGVHKRGAA
jgi:hypothetical protein